MRQRTVLAPTQGSVHVRSLSCHSLRGWGSDRCLLAPSARWAVSKPGLSPHCLCLGARRRAGDHEAERRGVYQKRWEKLSDAQALVGRTHDWITFPFCFFHLGLGY